MNFEEDVKKKILQSDFAKNNGRILRTVNILQRLLQSGGNAAGVAGAAQIARDDSELPVARAVVERGQFHAGKYGG